MKKKHDPLVRDHLPAMFVGDEPPQAQPVSALELVGRAPAAAMLPQDLCVTVEGAHRSPVRVVFAPLMAALFGGLASVEAADPSVFSFVMAGLYACTAAIFVRFAWTELRAMFAGREEYRLDEARQVVEAVEAGRPIPATPRYGAG